MNFVQRLENDPRDWDLRLIYADWLEDQGELVLAAGQRWQATHHRRPLLSHAMTLGRHWYWFFKDEVADYRCNASFLPLLFNTGLTGGKNLSQRGDVPWGKQYETMSMAEADLAQALGLLGVEGLTWKY